MTKVHVHAVRSNNRPPGSDVRQITLGPSGRPLGQDRKFLRKAVLWMRQLLGILG
jgi:hypothetical protein